MYKAVVIGYFANGLSRAGGQEAKTWNVTEMLEKVYGPEQISTIDTLNWRKSPFKLFKKIVSTSSKSQNVIMLPAQNSIKVFIPLFWILRIIFGVKIHYVVVGGWLPEFLNTRPILKNMAKKLDGIYVELNGMKKRLEKKNFSNIVYFPNFKNLEILPVHKLVNDYRQPLKLCTFSRVSKEKGIELAINAVKQINKYYAENVFTLDIYGKIEENYLDEFNNIIEEFPQYISYVGMVEPSQSVEVLKSYYALLFPTYYEGEGFAGTLIDALSAGVPIVASDWKYNSEIVKDMHTGILVEANNEKKLYETLEWILTHSSQWITMKKNCVKEAARYCPDCVMKALVDQME